MTDERHGAGSGRADGGADAGPPGLRAAGRFRLPGEVVEAVPWGSGHINDTFVVTCALASGSRPDAGVRGAPTSPADRGAAGRRRYVLQHINLDVFPDPETLMENVVRVTRHIGAKLEEAGAEDAHRRVLTVVPATDGRPYAWVDGEFWRAYDFIEGTSTHDTAVSPRLACEAAAAFGRFQAQLIDLPPPRLAEPIRRFHDTPYRLEQLREAVRADAAGRVAGAEEEIEAAERQAALATALVSRQESGDLPERVTHNDTKINNVLIDDESGEGICVIDLDTVMPGLVPYDFGDMVRTAGSPAAEDERDLERVRLDLETFEALVRGYLSTAGSFLTAAERQSLAISGPVITLEMAMRFLTDHLRGDTYFKVHRPDHNLDRARAQLALLAELRRHEGELAAIVTAANTYP